MITVNNAESYLKDKIGKDSDDIKKIWDTFKDFCKESVREKKIEKLYFNVVFMILLERNYFILILYVSLLFMKMTSILIWNNFTVNFYLNQQLS